MGQKIKKKITIFISYAPDDEPFLKQLTRHLSPLVRQGLIEPWYNRNISAETDGQEAIDVHLSRADIILLLVSANFISSDYRYGTEMGQAMELHVRGKASVIPIFLRPVKIEGSGLPIERLAMLPKNGRPVTDWPDVDAAWSHVVDGIHEVVKDLHMKQSQEGFSIENYAKTYERVKALVTILRTVARIIGDPLPDLPSDPAQPWLHMTTASEDLLQLSSDIEQNIFKILTMGEFNHGKSTLLNALLGKKVLPTKVIPETAIITMLEYGNSPDVEIYLKDQAEPLVVTQEEFRTQYRRYELKKAHKKEHYDKIRYARLKFPYTLLRNGVRLVDSPGLNANEHHTEITDEFLRQSSAVIFVLNMNKPLSLNEKEYIQDRLGKGLLPHVFFAVNRMNSSIEGQRDAKDSSIEDQRDAVDEYLREELAPHFTDPSSQTFNERLYSERVFYIDTRVAFQARIDRDAARYEQSGVRALEDALEHFLTSEEKVLAVLGNATQTLRGVIEDAQEHVLEQKIAKQLPLAELLQRQKEAGNELANLKQQVEELKEGGIPHSSDKIRKKMVSSLRDYLKKMDRDWDKKGKPHFADVLAAHDVQAELNQCVHSYLDKNFKHWMQGKAEDDVREALRDFQKDLKQYIVRIEGNLQRNRQTFSGIKSVKIPVEKHLPGVAAIDAANIADEILIKNGWNDVLQQVSSSMQTRSEMQEWSESLRVQVASRIPFLNRVIDRELQEWKENVKRGNEAFLKQLRETLYRELEHQLPQIEHEIGKEVKKRLKKVVSKIADRLSKQIEELIRQQAHIIEDMKQEGFSLQETLRRLESIEQLLLDALSKAETMLSEPQE